MPWLLLILVHKRKKAFFGRMGLATCNVKCKKRKRNAKCSLSQFRIHISIHMKIFCPSLFLFFPFFSLQQLRKLEATSFSFKIVKWKWKKKERKRETELAFQVCMLCYVIIAGVGWSCSIFYLFLCWLLATLPLL